MLALVSELNCFLRSRCSMEMWCPDDTGRDSWDWVGPPAWGRACFNSPKWGGGSSPVKSEPPQIVSMLLLLWWWYGRVACMTCLCNTAACTELGGRSPGSQTPGDPATPSPPYWWGYPSTLLSTGSQNCLTQTSKTTMMPKTKGLPTTSEHSGKQTQSKEHQTMQNQPYHCCERRARPLPIGKGKNERAERPTPGMSTPLSKKDEAQFALCVPKDTFTWKMQTKSTKASLTDAKHVSTVEQISADCGNKPGCHPQKNPHFQALQSNIQRRTSGCQLRGVAEAP